MGPKKPPQRAVRRWLPRLGPPGRFTLIRGNGQGVCFKCGKSVGRGTTIILDRSTGHLLHKRCSDPRLVEELETREAKQRLVEVAMRTGKKPKKFKGLRPTPPSRRRSRTIAEEEGILIAKRKRAGSSTTIFGFGSSGGSVRPADENLHRKIGPVQNYGDDT